MFLCRWRPSALPLKFIWASNEYINIFPPIITKADQFTAQMLLCIERLHPNPTSFIRTYIVHRDLHTTPLLVFRDDSDLRPLKPLHGNPYRVRSLVDNFFQRGDKTCNVHWQKKTYIFIHSSYPSYLQESAEIIKPQHVRNILPLPKRRPNVWAYLRPSYR